MGKNDGVSQSPPEDADSRHVTIRQRITFAMILLVVFVLLATGTMLLLLGERSISDRVARELLLDKEEFAVLAVEGVDPVTGQPFAGPIELLGTYLTRSILNPYEGELGYIEGELYWESKDGVDFLPEADPGLMSHITPLTVLDVVSSGTLRTDLGHYQYLVTPVQFPDAAGALVQVHDLEVSRAELLETMLAFLAIAIAALVAASVVAWALVGRLLRPVEELRQAAESIDEHDLTSRVPERGNDDLTRLSMSINRMLDRLQNAVDGQRTLLDDVGHELRTPLTIVRGHLELVDLHDPADVAQTRDLALDEVDRMGGLVNDLLTLAKASQSDFISPSGTRWPR